jgi:hypothetical protein
MFRAYPGGPGLLVDPGLRYGLMDLELLEDLLVRLLLEFRGVPFQNHAAGDGQSVLPGERGRSGQSKINERDCRLAGVTGLRLDAQGASAIRARTANGALRPCDSRKQAYCGDQYTVLQIVL